MQYEGNIIRPPSEADSIILQVTVGCSHNHCTFCGAYRDKEFRLKDEETVREDIDFAAACCRRQKTVFLADGDALAIPQAELVSLLSLIREKLPWVRRISLYANSRDILSRSAAELRVLNDLGLKRIYMGLETGHDPTLKAICKGAGSGEMIRAGRLVRAAGIFLSVTVLLGIAGSSHSLDHALATARVLNEMEPSQIAVLTLMLMDNTPLGRQYRAGSFHLPDQDMMFRELRALVGHIRGIKAQFQANHASNYFALAGRLPRDQEKFIAIIDQALSGTIELKPEARRAL
ncbi:Radical SAM [hydrothermal vent metagenome]|uniref:Radical SAM n=1 Tax=hydrothermal vent metagenome TaxID=652676 RepID=A0A3B0W924_9ZZZZ